MTKRLWPLLLTFATCCVGPAVVNRPAPCLAVLVENTRFEDVRVHIGGRRVGLATGLRQTQLRICGGVDLTTQKVQVTPVAGQTFRVYIDGPQRPSEGQGLLVHVGPTANFSYARLTHVG